MSPLDWALSAVTWSHINRGQRELDTEVRHRTKTAAESTGVAASQGMLQLPEARRDKEWIPP